MACLGPPLEGRGWSRGCLHAIQEGKWEASLHLEALFPTDMNLKLTPCGNFPVPDSGVILVSQLWPVSLKHMAEYILTLISGQVLMKINSGWYTDKNAGLLQSAIERTIRPCNARKLTHFSFIIWDQSLRNPLKLWIIKSFRHLIPRLWCSCAMLYNNILLFLPKATLALTDFRPWLRKTSHHGKISWVPL